MNDMVGRLDIDAESDSQWGENDDSKSRPCLKILELFLPTRCTAGFGRGIAIDNIRDDTESFGYGPLQRPLEIPEFTKQNDFFLLGVNQL